MAAADTEMLVGLRLDHASAARTGLAAQREIQKQINRVQISPKTRAGGGPGGGPSGLKPSFDPNVNRQLKENIRASEAAASANEKYRRSLVSTSKATDTFGKRLGVTASRFSAYVVAATAFYQLAGSIDAAARSVVNLDRQAIKLRQILSDTSIDPNKVFSGVLDVAEQYGQQVNDILDITNLLSQSGSKFSSQNAIVNTVRELAKTQLGATFGNLEETSEGLIAFLSQFNKEASETASILDAANVLAKRFTVESGDLFTAVKSGGSAFAIADGDIEEFMSTVTAVRQLTRQSASTIGVGLNTIALRTLRPDTIAFLDELTGSKIRDANGELKGILEIMQEIANATRGFSAEQMAPVIEQVAGIRQARVFTPLLKDLQRQGPESITRSALQAAQGSAGSLNKDVEMGLERIDIMLASVGARYQEVFANIANDPALKVFIKNLVDIAKAGADILDVAAPLIPLLLQLGTLKLGLTVAKGVPNFMGSVKNQFGQVGASRSPETAFSLASMSPRKEELAEALKRDKLAAQANTRRTLKELTNKVSSDDVVAVAQYRDSLVEKEKRLAQELKEADAKLIEAMKASGQAGGITAGTISSERGRLIAEYKKLASSGASTTYNIDQENNRLLKTLNDNLDPLVTLPAKIADKIQKYEARMAAGLSQTRQIVGGNKIDRMITKLSMIPGGQEAAGGFRTQLSQIKNTGQGPSGQRFYDKAMEKNSGSLTQAVVEEIKRDNVATKQVLDTARKERLNAVADAARREFLNTPGGKTIQRNVLSEYKNLLKSGLGVLNISSATLQPIIRGQEAEKELNRRIDEALLKRLAGQGKMTEELQKILGAPLLNISQLNSQQIKKFSTNITQAAARQRATFNSGAFSSLIKMDEDVFKTLEAEQARKLNSQREIRRIRPTNPKQTGLIDKVDFALHKAQDLPSGSPMRKRVEDRLNTLRTKLLERVKDHELTVQKSVSTMEQIEKDLYSVRGDYRAASPRARARVRAARERIVGGRDRIIQRDEKEITSKFGKNLTSQQAELRNFMVGQQKLARSVSDMATRLQRAAGTTDSLKSDVARLKKAYSTATTDVERTKIGDDLKRAEQHLIRYNAAVAKMTTQMEANIALSQNRLTNQQLVGTNRSRYTDPAFIKRRETLGRRAIPESSIIAPTRGTRALDIDRRERLELIRARANQRQSERGIPVRPVLRNDSMGLTGFNKRLAQTNEAASRLARSDAMAGLGTMISQIGATSLAFGMLSNDLKKAEEGVRAFQDANGELVRDLDSVRQTRIDASKAQQRQTGGFTGSFVGAMALGGLGGAAFASAGAALGIAAGGALGSILPGLGTVFGAAAGAWLGAKLGGLITDAMSDAEFLEVARQQGEAFAASVKQSSAKNEGTTGITEQNAAALAFLAIDQRMKDQLLWTRGKEEWVSGGTGGGGVKVEGKRIRRSFEDMKALLETSPDFQPYMEGIRTSLEEFEIDGKLVDTSDAKKTLENIREKLVSDYMEAFSKGGTSALEASIRAKGVDSGDSAETIEAEVTKQLQDYRDTRSLINSMYSIALGEETMSQDVLMRAGEAHSSMEFFANFLKERVRGIGFIFKQIQEETERTQVSLRRQTLQQQRAGELRSFLSGVGPRATISDEFISSEYDYLRQQTNQALGVYGQLLQDAVRSAQDQFPEPQDTGLRKRFLKSDKIRGPLDQFIEEINNNITGALSNLGISDQDIGVISESMRISEVAKSVGEDISQRLTKRTVGTADTEEAGRRLLQDYNSIFENLRTGAKTPEAKARVTEIMDQLQAALETIGDGPEGLNAFVSSLESEAQAQDDILRARFMQAFMPLQEAQQQFGNIIDRVTSYLGKLNETEQKRLSIIESAQARVVGATSQTQLRFNQDNIRGLGGTGTNIRSLMSQIVALRERRAAGEGVLTPEENNELDERLQSLAISLEHEETRLTSVTEKLVQRFDMLQTEIARITSGFEQLGQMSPEDFQKAQEAVLRSQSMFDLGTVQNVDQLSLLSDSQLQQMVDQFAPFTMSQDMNEIIGRLGSIGDLSVDPYRTGAESAQLASTLLGIARSQESGIVGQGDFAKLRELIAERDKAQNQLANIQSSQLVVLEQIRDGIGKALGQDLNALGTRAPNVDVNRQQQPIQRVAEPSVDIQRITESFARTMEANQAANNTRMADVMGGLMQELIANAQQNFGQHNPNETNMHVNGRIDVTGLVTSREELKAAAVMLQFTRSMIRSLDPSDPNQAGLIQTLTSVEKQLESEMKGAGRSNAR